MRKLLKDIILKCELKSVEILIRKRIINEFSIWCVKNGGEYSLSFSHNVAYFVIEFECLFAYSVILVTNRSFSDPNAR